MTWPMKRLRYLATFNPPVPSSVRTDAEGDYPLLPMDSINEFTETGAPEVRPVGDLLNGYSYLEPTDVAYAKVTPCFENGKGLIGSVLDGPTFATTEITVLRPHNSVNQRFLGYLLQSSAFRHAAIASMTGAGGLKRVSETAMRDLRVPAPPLEEQRLIADYLDRETAEIDAFISELRLLADLTFEYLSSKAAELLAPSVGSKKGWTETHLGPLISITAGQVDPKKGRYRDMPLIAPNHIESRTSRLLGLETAAEQGAESGKYLAKEGQVLFSKIRPTLMKSTLAPTDCLTSADMYPIEVNSRFITNTFLLEYLLGPQFEDYAARESARVAMPKLNRETLSAAPIALPPLEHQELVARQMRNARTQAEAHLAEVGSAIRLGKERRAALISAAVTGQVDVTTQGVSVTEQLRDELEVHV